MLAKRVGYLCSNPNCRALTIGANNTTDKSTSIGIAAHITAASTGGPRYNPNLTTEQRQHIDNGVWLCSNCATLIDKDPASYSLESLEIWKLNAEHETMQKLNGEYKAQAKGIPFLEADLIWKNGGRYNMGYSAKNPIEDFNGQPVFVVSDAPIIYWELEWKFNFVIFNNSNYPAYNVKIESVGSEHFTYIDKLPKVNNIPPLKNIDLTAKYSENIESIHSEADEILKHKIPEKFKNLILKISYLDDERREHSTYVKFDSGDIINTR